MILLSYYLKDNIISPFQSEDVSYTTIFIYRLITISNCHCCDWTQMIQTTLKNSTSVSGGKAGRE